MTTVLIQFLRSFFYGFIGLGTEAMWRALMQSKPAHWLIHSVLGRFSPFDAEMARKIERHFRQRTILTPHVPLGMIVMYAPGLSFGFDAINWVANHAATRGGRIAWHVPLYPLGVWVAELLVGSIFTKKRADGTTRPLWWDYKEDGYWIINGVRYETHLWGKIRFDYFPAWMFMGFFMEFVRRVGDRVMPLVAESIVEQALWAYHFVSSLV